MPERATPAGQPGTYAGPGLQGPPGKVIGLSRPFDEIVAPVVPFIILMGCVSLLVAKNRDARRLWLLVSLIVVFASAFYSAIAVRAILFAWRYR